MKMGALSSPFWRFSARAVLDRHGAPLRLLSEMAAALKPDGIAVFSMPLPAAQVFPTRSRVTGSLSTRRSCGVSMLQIRAL